MRQTNKSFFANWNEMFSLHFVRNVLSLRKSSLFQKTARQYSVADWDRGLSSISEFLIQLHIKKYMNNIAKEKTEVFKLK